MNTAAPDPSASFKRELVLLMQRHGIASLIYTTDDGIHACPHDARNKSWNLGWPCADKASAPAAAVGGDLIEQVTAALITESTNHPHGESPGESWRRLARVAVALCTPAAPVGGFVVEALAKLVYEQWASHPKYVPWIERGNSNKQDEARAMVRKVIAASPAAQSSAKDGARVAKPAAWASLDLREVVSDKSMQCGHIDATHYPVPLHIQATTGSGLVDCYSRDQIMAGLKEHYVTVSGDRRETPAAQMAHEVMQAIEKAAIGREVSK